MMRLGRFLIIALSIFLLSCNQKTSGDMNDTNSIRLMVLNPGHFHAALVQKEMYSGVDKEVYVYAPEGMELDDYLQRIESYNSREESPTSWELHVYRGEDFLEKMLSEKPGNLVVLAGNNNYKTEYIHACVDAGIHVLADKPMAINRADFQILQSAYAQADEKGLLIDDIMTERFEITSMLQRQFALREDIFGTLIPGSPELPSITKESVHHFFKYVSGKALRRPAWFFDVEQEGEAIADVGTHLVDLVMWEAVPEGVRNFEKDIHILTSERWTSDLSREQFRKVTGLDTYPDYLMKYISDDTLHTISNSAITFKINDFHAKVSVEWSFQAPEGAGDTHFSIMRGTVSDLLIKQGEEESYIPELYIVAKDKKHIGHIENSLQLFMNEELEAQYPGLALEALGNGMWRVNIPKKYRNGHEAHFVQVSENFLTYFKDGSIPDQEKQRLLAKYYTTTKAVDLAH